ncbi:uncharacterized protein LOC135500999 [Lineus longissimus]|uniref:uncharacterized protein LOC135500999 n=1 Tax=Lineus longissimus TaxID=88925 RepID=UPI00315CAA82
MYRSPNVDHFTFVLTDIESKYKFGFCRYATRAETCLCIVSCLPWYEVFYKLLNSLAEILNRTDNNAIGPLLSAITQRPMPSPNEQVEIISACAKQSFTFTCPDPERLPTVPENRNLTEYYTAIDPHNMMVIFASMLYERRILITSRRMSRLTACVHGSASLLYPMYWQHLYIPVLPAHLLDYCSAPMPFMIGIHSNLMTKTKPMELGDVVILDADNNTVITEYDDLATLPPEIVSSLKKRLKGQQTDKIKTDSGLGGDGLARAFLKALVGLIGGYRDALKFREGEQITFDREAFVISRPPSMQPFLEKILQLQIFVQFINDRLDLLNTGQGFTDEFEMEVNMWADKMGTSSKYKEWLSSAKKKGKHLKREGKEKWNDFTSKANPAVKSAVRTVKDKSKKAYKDFRSKFDDLKKDTSKLGTILPLQDSDDDMHAYQKFSDDDILTSVIYRSGTSHALGREGGATTLAQQLRPSRPPRPPLPDRRQTMGSTHRLGQSQTSGKPKQYKLMSLDDMSIADSDKMLEAPRTSIRLFDDPDIQLALKKSYSLEDIVSKSKKESLLEDDEEEVFSESSSDDESEGVKILTGPPVAPPRKKRPVEYTLSGSKKYSSGSDTSSLSCPGDEVDHPIVPPRRASSRRTEKALIDLNSPESQVEGSANAFVDNFVQKRAQDINHGFPTLASIRGQEVTGRERTPEAENAVQKLRDMYARLEDTKNSSPEHEVNLDIRTIQSRHVGNVTKLKAVYLGQEESPVAAHRPLQSRSSVVSRSPAFKRPSDEKPELQRSSIEGASDMDLFDPLSRSSVSPQKGTTTMTSEDVNLLKDWSLNFSSLASGSNSTVPQSSVSNINQNISNQNRTVGPFCGPSANQSQGLSVQTPPQPSGYQTGYTSSGFSQISQTGVQPRQSPSGSPNSLRSARPPHQQFMSSPSPPGAQTGLMFTNSAPPSAIPVPTPRNSIAQTTPQNFTPVPAPRNSVGGNPTTLLRMNTTGAKTTADPFGDLVDISQVKSSNNQQTWEKFE